MKRLVSWTCALAALSLAMSAIAAAPAPKEPKDPKPIARSLAKCTPPAANAKSVPRKGANDGDGKKGAKKTSKGPSATPIFKPSKDTH